MTAALTWETAMDYAVQKSPGVGGGPLGRSSTNDIAPAPQAPLMSEMEHHVSVIENMVTDLCGAVYKHAGPPRDDGMSSALEPDTQGALQELNRRLNNIQGNLGYLVAKFAEIG